MFYMIKKTFRDIYVLKTKNDKITKIFSKWLTSISFYYIIKFKIKF